MQTQQTQVNFLVADGEDQADLAFIVARAMELGINLPVAVDLDDPKLWCLLFPDSPRKWGFPVEYYGDYQPRQTSEALEIEVQARRHGYGDPNAIITFKQPRDDGFAQHSAAHWLTLYPAN